MKSKIRGVLDHLKRSSEQPWYLPVAVTFAFLDAYIPVVPNELFLTLGILPRSQRWLRVSVAFSIASAAGATSLALLSRAFGQAVLQNLFPDLLLDPTWLETVRWVEVNGVMGLALVAAGPFPQHAAVVALALTHTPLTLIFAAVLIGRFLKYAVVAWLAAKSPATLAILSIYSVERAPATEDKTPGVRGDPLYFGPLQEIK